MNPAFVYRQHGRSIFWIAFTSALAIHLAAVAFAKTKSPIDKLHDVTPLSDVEVVDIVEATPALLEESPVLPPLEQDRRDQDSLYEENVTPPPIRARRKARPVSLVKGTTMASLRSVKAKLAYAPRPVYPYEARRQRMTGSGIALLTVDQTSGTVTDVRMAQSCGNAILDNSTIDAFRRWRFKPGGVTQVEVPITYTLMGVSY
ncbi:MAG: energy transducer TonB [Candidatus Udaeobacter sp.]